MSESAVEFPAGFLWGAATSAYQIEGAVDVDGRGPSIWDVLCQRPGAISDGDDGTVSVDHYHRYRDDVALMRSLGLKAYRFSVAWPRVQPTGAGTVNQAGLGFYDRLVDALLEADIEPTATLYHWDLPQALEEQGGWPSRETALRFAEYAAIVFERLHDRVPRWATLNEPWCTSLLGYADGEHAPGRRDATLATRAIHHLLLGHGLAVRAMRAIDAAPAQGIVLNLQPIRSLEVQPDVSLAEGIRRFDGLRNRVWTEPLLRARYPDDVAHDLATFGGLPVEDGDLATIAQPLDWLGINYYNDEILENRPGGDIPCAPGIVDVATVTAGLDATDMGWPLTPDGLRYLLVSEKAAYPDLPPVYITENGVAYDDPLVDGAVHDQRRIHYLDAHLRALHEAIDAGVDVRGYFQWSLLDNFEWSHGYRMRFGMVHVDYDTLVRTPKDSAYWYRDVITRNGLAPAPGQATSTTLK